MFGNGLKGLEVSDLRSYYSKKVQKYLGDTEKLKTLDEVYFEALRVIDKDLPEEEKLNWRHEERLADKIRIVAPLDDVRIDVFGSWLWIRGETKKHKDFLRENGFFFSKNKLAWYYRDEDQKGRWFRGTASWGTIKEKYGSQSKNKDLFALV
jgi:hypothetical protein